MRIQTYLTFLASTLWLCACMPKFKDEGLPTPNQDPIYQTLTGQGNTSGRTWRPIANARYMGIGHENSIYPNLFKFPEEVTTNLDAWNSGVFQNTYTFIEAGNDFIPKSSKSTAWGGCDLSHLGISSNNREDIMLIDPNLKPSCFKLRNERNGIGTGYTLEITDGSYMGRFDGCYKYQILSISNDTLKLRHLYQSRSTSDNSLHTYAWHHTYVSNHNQDPPPSLDLIFSLLTDGNSLNGKTWRPTSFGLGSSSKDAMKPDFFNFNNGASYSAWTLGILKNRYTFIGIGNRFIPQNNNTTVLGSYAATHFGISSNGSEYCFTTDIHLKETKFKLVNEKNGIGTGYTLEITDRGYMGHFDNTQKYQIMSISKNMLQLRHLYSNDPNTDPNLGDYAWYSNYVNNEDLEATTLSTDSVHKLLTGNNNTQGKTWKHASNSNMIGTGTAWSLRPEKYLYYDHYSKPWINGLFKNRFTFVGSTNKFIPLNQSATTNYAFANKLFGMDLQKNEFTAITDPKLQPSKFLIQNEKTSVGTGYTLRILEGGYIGILDSRSKYQIMSITNDNMVLRHIHIEDPFDYTKIDSIAWYSTYTKE